MRTNILNFHFNLLYWVSFRGATCVVLSYPVCYTMDCGSFGNVTMGMTVSGCQRSCLGYVWHCGLMGDS